MESQKFNISLSSISKWLTYCLYSSMVGIILLSETNPIFKISMALYVGVSVTILLLYGFIIYFRSITSSKESTAKNSGFLWMLVSFIPNLIAQLSRGLVGLVTLSYKLCNKKPVDLDSNVVAYLLVNLRKIVALLCWCYITEEDDGDMHEKAFLVFCFFNIIQHFFIAKSQPKKNLGRPSLIDGLKSFVKVGKNSKVEAGRLRFRRNFLLSLNCLMLIFLFSSMFHLYVQIENIYSFAIPMLNKLILLIDMEFLKSLCFELGGLQFTFKNVDFSIV
ncbi:unnamed protein product [Ambrosiozyma monospora]|uniref:Unnamed protein product n=1 Tax=Ambrosiozyma monospora TaxID=43982 RepID=A0A9W7DHV3_AMBMO|nr:unnamed protein product [Ambrosiozyma monospora]